MGGWQTKFNVSLGPGLCSLVLGPFGPDLGLDMDLTWDLDLDLSLTIYFWARILRKLKDPSGESGLFRIGCLKEGDI